MRGFFYAVTWLAVKRIFFLWLYLLLPVTALFAQSAKPFALPDFTFTYQSSDGYRWKKAGEVKGRTILGNTVLAVDSAVYSFGGFDTHIAQREMNRIVDGKLLREDSFHYPGKGFFFNIAFLRDSFLYIGGGNDSGAMHYAQSDFWQYNRNTGGWKRLADLPFYYHYAVSVFEHRGETVVLVPQLSGAGFEIVTPTFYTYDAAADRWRLLSNSQPDSALWRPATFQIGNDIYALFQEHHYFGGGGDNRFYKFNLDSLKWTALAPMPGSVKDFAFAFSDGHYGFIGGGGSTGGAVFTNTVFRYDPYQARWEEIRRLPRFIRHAVAWTFLGERYVGFGINEEADTVIIWKLTHR